MNISQDRFATLREEDLQQLFIEHGFTALRICATGILNSFWLCWLNPALAFWLKWNLSNEQLFSLIYFLILKSGYHIFPKTITLIGRMAVTEPNPENVQNTNP